jgi:hypothetical protein
LLLLVFGEMMAFGIAAPIAIIAWFRPTLKGFLDRAAIFKSDLTHGSLKMGVTF